MRAAKIDANHEQVVTALRAAGATVQSLAGVGKGVPDLLVGYQGQTLLMEVKDGFKPPSKRALNEDQLKQVLPMQNDINSILNAVKKGDILAINEIQKRYADTNIR